MDQTHWIFLHGAASTQDVWARQRRLFRDAVWFDYPDQARDVQHLLADYIRTLHLAVPGRVVLVGHSMGGAVAQLYALQFPEKTAALILVGTGAHLPVSQRLLSGLEDKPIETLETVADLCLHRGADPRLRRVCRDMMVRQDPTLAYRQFLACSLFDIRERLDRLSTLPRYGIVGADDKMTPISLMDTLRLPDDHIFRVPEAGHLVMLEQPEAFNQALLTIQRQLEDKG